ncbi:MAG: hypothetical protein J6Q83_00750 [Clostridia bacterium]|nr:hypothetical protein [Clostridia bacterium]
MANIFGSCTGSLGSKYDLWITVIQNSQSLAENKSNITANFFIRRNDGEATSAYNLIEEQNSVSLKVGGTTRVSKNLTIDTRDNVYFRLATWTGDVAHNADGTLNLAINGQFTMGNANLTGGSVSGSFKCTPLGKASTLSFGDTTVNPGGVVRATINSPSAAFTHKIKWSLGSKSQTMSLAAGVSVADFTVPLAWTSEIQKSLYGTLAVTLDTYNGGEKTGSSSYSIRVVIPATDGFRPSFEMLLERNDNDVPSDWNEYVKGISTLTVELANVTYKYGAEYYSATITVGNVTKREMPATFELTQAGQITVTATVKDNRGLTTVETATITVQDYAPPSVAIMSVDRCNLVGEIDSMGTYALLKYTPSISSVNGKNIGSVTVKYKAMQEQLWSVPVPAPQLNVPFGDGAFDVTSTYAICFSVKDSICKESVATVLYLPGGDIPFNIRKGGKGAAFGKFSESDNLLDVNWDMRVNGSMELAGMLNYEVVSCECTEKARDLLADLRYYPALNTVFVRMRLVADTGLAANDTHYVAKVSNRFPGLFMPMSCMVGFESGGQSTAGVLYGSGYIVVRSDEPVLPGTQIYISGFYVADYKGA